MSLAEGHEPIFPSRRQVVGDGEASNLGGDGGDRPAPVGGERLGEGCTSSLAPGDRQTAQLPVSSPHPDDRIELKLTVVSSWNIQFGQLVEPAAAFLASEPNLARTEILLLQEMDEAGTRYIADQLGFAWCYAMASVHPQSGRPFGNAVLSRHPIRAHRVIELPHQARLAGQPRLALVADIDIDGTHVVAASVHTEIPLLEPGRRRDQFGVLSRTLADAHCTPVLVGGDFNTATTLGRRRLRMTMGQYGFAELSYGVGPTLRRHRRNYLLDHIFGRGMTPVATGSPDGRIASDHDPIWVDVAIDDATMGKPASTTEQMP